MRIYMPGTVLHRAQITVKKRVELGEELPYYQAELMEDRGAYKKGDTVDIYKHEMEGEENG